MKIKQLPPQVANQIAAGEVVERPASVVKELLENALDAKATVIECDIRGGGLNQIRISDDGIGIDKQDLPLALSAHATSKIEQIEDLYAIHSMGFRGEALASIASVSKLSIASRSVDAQQAYKITASDDEQLVTPCAHKQGTTIEVNDLFYNTPVRRKFIKSDKTEFQHIEAVVKRFAMSCFDVAIKLSHNQRQVFNLPAVRTTAQQLKRISKIFGGQFVKHAKHIDVSHTGLRLHGWLSDAEFMRSSNDKQYFYLNKRMVKDKLLNHAMKKVYEERLYPGRHAAFLLFLELNPGEVDVNVHPTKHEVRFEQPRLIHDFIVSHCNQVLGQNATQPEPNIPETNYQALLPECATHYPAPVAQGWFYIDEQHAIVKVENAAVLVNLARIYEDFLCAQLSASTRQARPVLVPMRVNVSAAQLQRLHVLQPRLETLGLSFSQVDEQCILIRSIPALLAQLDVQGFIDSLPMIEKITEHQLIQLLCAANTFSAALLSDEEKNQIEKHLAHLQTLKPSQKGIYRTLYRTDAKELLDG